MRDEEGRPRRFLSHREAVVWAVRRVLLFVGSLTLVGVVGALGRGFIRSRESDVTENVLPEALAYVAFVLVSFVCIGLMVAGALYLFVALHGGVMDVEARQRYREEQAAQREFRVDAYSGRHG